MKTISKISVLKYLLSGMLSLLFAPTVHGDSWAPPRVVTVSSPSSNFIAQVTPGSEGYGGYERAITNRANNASAIVSVRLQPGITNVAWTGKLINPAAPVEVHVSDAGYLVTLDNYHNLGYGPIVAIYDPKGRLLRHWSLEELFKPEERWQLQLHHSSISSIWWRSEQAYFAGDTNTSILVVPAVGKTLVFALTDGTLLMDSSTLTNTESGRREVLSLPAPTPPVMRVRDRRFRSD